MPQRRKPGKNPRPRGAILLRMTQEDLARLDAAAARLGLALEGKREPGPRQALIYQLIAAYLDEVEPKPLDN